MLLHSMSACLVRNMKFSTACAVFAVFAAAAAPARANPPVSTVFLTGDVFSQLIKTQALIKAVEKENNLVLLPALNVISQKLCQDVDSDVSRIGSGILNSLGGVILRVEQISGNASLILSQIESTAHTISTLHYRDARLDYTKKRNHVKKLCRHTLATTNVVLRLIDETKELLGKGVAVPLRTLQLAMQQTTINNSKWSFLTKFAVERLLVWLLEHITWLEGVCMNIRNELDNERTGISYIEGKIKGTQVTVNAINDGFDILAESQNMSDENLRQGSQNLVHVMNQLRDEVRKITRSRVRRAAAPYYEAAAESYQIATKHSSPSVSHEQPDTPSWLNKTSDNGCVYIYSNRTIGCIYVKTLNYMKVQYTWLSQKVLKFEAMFKAYEKGWNNLTTQVLNVSKNSSNRREAIKFVAELETNKLMWRDDIKKVRDLSVSLNSYAESLFSEANAQLNIKHSSDKALNKGVMRVVFDNKQSSIEVLSKNVDDSLVINQQVADFLRRFPVLCASGEQKVSNG